jgi:uncharacterized protein (UPF0179 family)
MALVTLIGERLAKKDLEFIYIGPNNDCKNCKLKTVCFNLKENKRYKINKVRDKKHNCKIHEGTATVVEVEELPILTAIDKKYSEGAKSKIEKKDCNNIGCENYRYCRVKLQKEKTYEIKKIQGDIKCPLGYKLQKAEIKEE